jgi:hypothetical protein
MSIRSYRFGKIEIDGRSYTSDVILTPEGGVDTWWRRDGHSLAVGDLAPILAARPDILVIGTGYLGRMIVSQDARRHLEAHGVHVRDANAPGRRGLQPLAGAARPGRCRAPFDLLRTYSLDSQVSPHATMMCSLGCRRLAAFEPLSQPLKYGRRLGLQTALQEPLDDAFEGATRHVELRSIHIDQVVGPARLSSNDCRQS